MCSFRSLTEFYLNLTTSFPALSNSLCLPQFPAAAGLKLLHFGLDLPILTLKWRADCEESVPGTVYPSSWYSLLGRVGFLAYFPLALLRPDVYQCSLKCLCSWLSFGTLSFWHSGGCPRGLGPLALEPRASTWLAGWPARSLHPDLFLQHWYPSLLGSVHRITKYNFICLMLWLLCTKPVFPNLSERMSSACLFLKDRGLQCCRACTTVLQHVFCYRYLIRCVKR